MTEKVKYYTLYELLSSVGRMFEKHWTNSFWIKAEVAKLNYYPKSGHCYPLLVEKSNDRTIAEVRSTMWSTIYNQTQENFRKISSEGLKDGMELLMQVKVEFTPNHGLTLSILQVDTNFSLGLMEKERLACINKLKSENIFNSNKEIQLSTLIKNIAIISVETSKGYQDFIETLKSKSDTFTVEHDLFPALLQGDKAVDSIRIQLDEIRQKSHKYDAVFIIRGGGGEVGLNCYDHYNLASYVARFPLPVLTGIGHSSNLTVVEQVANKNLITPTALANFVIDQFEEFKLRLDKSRYSIKSNFEKLFKYEKLKLDNLNADLVYMSNELIKNNRNSISYLIENLNKSVKYNLNLSHSNLLRKSDSLSWSLKSMLKENNLKLTDLSLSLKRSIDSSLNSKLEGLKLLEMKLQLLHPDNTLKRGYSIVKSSKGKIQLGSEVEIINFENIIKAKVNSIQKKDGEKK